MQFPQQAYYFQHPSLLPLLSRNSITFETTKGIDLNSPYSLSYAIEQSAKKGNYLSSFMNVLRHLLLIPATNCNLSNNMWRLIDMFVHQVVLLKDTARKVYNIINVFLMFSVYRNI